MDSIAIVIAVLLITVWYHPDHTAKVVKTISAPFIEQECRQ